MIIDAFPGIAHLRSVRRWRYGLASGVIPTAPSREVTPCPVPREARMPAAPTNQAPSGLTRRRELLRFFAAMGFAGPTAALLADHRPAAAAPTAGTAIPP